MAAQPKLFLSYAHNDGAQLAQRLLKDFTARGYNAWLDEERLKIGSSWSREIEDHLDRSDVVLALLSAGSFISEVCRGEQLRSLRNNKCVIPVLVQTNTDRPVYLEMRQYIDFSDETTYTLRLGDLVRAINSRAGATLVPEFKTTRYNTVPPLPQNFVPRPTELEALRQSLLNNRSRQAAIVALFGMGGIGKTVLAQALCQDDTIQAAFPDGIVWISIGENPTDADLVNQMREAARAVGCSPVGFDTLDHSSKLLRSLLKDKMVLLALDNVWDSLPVYHFQPSDDARFCRLLFTTRNDGIATAVGAHSQPLKILDAPCSRILLARYAGRAQNNLPKAAVEILRHCDGLPLALAMVGALLRNKSLPLWDDVLKSLSDADLNDIQFQFPNYPYPSLVAAIETSINYLDQNERKCYLDFAVFPNHASVPDSALEVAWGLDERKVRRIGEHLVSLSLAARDDMGHIKLHDLQLDYVRKCTANSLPELHARLLDRYEKRCPDGWHTGPNDGYFFEHLAHHLREAGRLQELRNILVDYMWLNRKLITSHVAGILSDFDTVFGLQRNIADQTPSKPVLSTTRLRIVDVGSENIDTFEVVSDHTYSKPLELIQGALQLSAHVIAKDPAQLASQMVSRLLPHRNVPTIEQFLGQIVASAPRPWLVLQYPTLHPPGTALIRTLEGHSAPVYGVAVSPDGRRVVSASWDNTLKVWDLDSGLELRTLVGHLDTVTSVAVSPDGRIAVSASEDQTLKVWNLDSGLELRTLEGHSNAVTSVAVSPDGHCVVSASEDETLKVWELETGRLVRTLKGRSSGVRSLALSPDGRCAISAHGNSTLKVWNLKTGRLIRTLKGHSDSISGVAACPDGRHAVSASRDKTLKMWDLETGLKLHTMEGHSNSVAGVAVGAEGRCAVSASWDNTLKMWDLETGRLVRTLEGHSSYVRAVVLSPEGRRAVSAADDRTLKVWDLEMGQALRMLAGHSSGVNSVAASLDARRAVSVSDDKTLIVWDLVTGQTLRTLKTHWQIDGVAISRDGRQAISATRDNTLRVWDLETGCALRTLEGHSDCVNGVAISPTWEWPVSASRDSTLKVWDLKTGKAVRTLKGHTSAVNNVAVSPDGRLAVSASRDRTLKVWDLKTGRALRTLKGHTSGVNDVAVSPDGRLAVSASDDKTLKVWNLRAASELRTLQGHFGTVRNVAVSLDGRLAVSASDDKMIKVWDLRTGMTVATFTCDAFARCCAFSGSREIVAGDAAGRIHFLSLR